MPPFIPHVDLRASNSLVEPAFFRELKTLYRKGVFSGGEYVERFEKEFAEYLGVPHCLGVNSGTSALHLALLALGIGPGDEVVVPAYTFAGSVWGVIYCGARPVFADVNFDTGNLSAEAVEKVLTKKTRAIIAVHLFGQAAPLAALGEIARKHRIPLIEDAAQAHGLLYEGRPAGTWGDIGCFSFYPTKNLGACGEAGAVVTSNRKWAQQISLLRNHNAKKRFEHLGLGFNYRMDGIQGLFLSLKLKELDRLNHTRRFIAAGYLRSIGKGGLDPLCREAGKSVWHAFVCKVTNRKAFTAHLDAVGIGHAIYYPKILPEQTAFRAYSPDPKQFPAAWELSRATVSLPLYPGMRKETLTRIWEALRDWR